jgi:signal peptidase
VRLKSKYRRIIIELSGVAIVALSIIGIFLGLQIALGTATPWVAVASGSMSPALEVGDLVIIQAVSPASIQVGDIIVFSTPQGSQTMHRVTKIHALPNGDLQFKTKGDANPSEDPYWISQRDVYGKVIYRIPFLGWLTLDPAFSILVAVTIIVIILLWPESRRRRRK